LPAGFLDRNKCAASFAADIEPELASFMADSQVSWGLDALQGAVSEPAWKTKPSHYLVASDDKMIPPPAQRAKAGRVKALIIVNLPLQLHFDLTLSKLWQHFRADTVGFFCTITVAKTHLALLSIH
jgi:hypothetical protein